MVLESINHINCGMGTEASKVVSRMWSSHDGTDE
jgi:hypothetical protein